MAGGPCSGAIPAFGACPAGLHLHKSPLSNAEAVHSWLLGTDVAQHSATGTEHALGKINLPEELFWVQSHQPEHQAPERRGVSQGNHLHLESISGSPIAGTTLALGVSGNTSIEPFLPSKG